MIYEEIKKDIEEWDEFINKFLSPSARLASISLFDGNRRVYRLNNRIFKIRKVIPESHIRENNFSGEYNILQKLKNVKGVCQNAQYNHSNGWEWMGYDCADGDTMENLLREKRIEKKIIIMIKIFWIIIRINLCGIAHRDIKPGNIIIGANNVVHLIDFDQAIVTSPLKAIFIDVFGIGSRKNVGYYSFRKLVKQNYGKLSFLLISIIRPLRVLKKIIGVKKNDQKPQISNGKIEVPYIMYLKRAWEIAKISNANSPGNNIAYYDLNVGGCHFPGERSWLLRWTEISKFKNVNFRNMKILECGCNLGLFSAFARRAGAKECVGVDCNKEILAGARLVSRALNVDNYFFQINFDSDELWEDKFVNFDMVIALSIVGWLKNKDRFIAFLGKHQEVIYEGHESLEVEINRLRNVGFKYIEIIFISERNRAVLYAHK